MIQQDCKYETSILDTASIKAFNNRLLALNTDV